MSYVIRDEGQTLEYDGQRYECVGFVPHVYADGSPGRLAIVASDCARCGERFAFTAPSFGEAFHPNRRCSKHKRPGAKVKRKGALIGRAQVPVL